VSEFLNVKSESISDDLVMRVISGSDDAVADLRAQLLFNGYVPCLPVRRVSISKTGRSLTTTGASVESSPTSR
jgi:hypothetical protein